MDRHEKKNYVGAFIKIIFVSERGNEQANKDIIVKDSKNYRSSLKELEKKNINIILIFKLESKM